MPRLHGEVCVVTGGARGIGRGIARAFAREGAAVVIADVDDVEGLAAADELGPLGGTGLFVRTDVRRREEVFDMVAQARDRFGRIDVLVTCAGATAPAVPLEEKTDLMFEAVLEVAYYGVLWAMQAVFPAMRDQGGGRVINFSSASADADTFGMADHVAAKGAIGGLTNSGAAEWAAHGILCNTISPTRLREVNAIAVDPERDIAPVAVFFASEDGRYMTGANIQVDGGLQFGRRAEATRGKVDLRTDFHTASTGGY